MRIFFIYYSTNLVGIVYLPCSIVVVVAVVAIIVVVADYSVDFVVAVNSFYSVYLFSSKHIPSNLSLNQYYPYQIVFKVTQCNIKHVKTMPNLIIGECSI